MKNGFKPNSRFSILIDDIPQKNDKSKDTLTYKKSENKEEKVNKERINKNNFLYDDRRKQEDINNKRDREMQEMLSMKHFPDLFGNIITIDEPKLMKEEMKKIDEPTIHQNDKPIINGIKIINNDVEKLLQPEKLQPEKLQPGWILLNKHNKLSKSLINEKFLTNEKSLTKKDIEIHNNEKPKTDHEIGIEIANSLIELHNKRTEEFIELNDYDTWEKMYKFPNWRQEENDLEDDTDNETNEDETDDEY